MARKPATQSNKSPDAVEPVEEATEVTEATEATETAEPVEEAPPAVESKHAPAQTISRPAKPKRQVEEVQSSSQEPDDSSDDDDDDYIDASELEQLRQQAKERQTLQQRLDEMQKGMKALQKQVKDYEREKLSDQEKKDLEYQEAQERATELAKKLQQMKAREAILLEAGKHSIDPELAIKLASNDIEFDDDGNATNTAEVLKGLAKQHPSLVQKPQASATATNPQKTQNKNNRGLTIDDIHAMSEAEINARWAEVQQVIAG